MSNKSTIDNVSKHYDLNTTFQKVGDKNFWVEFTGLAREYNAVNLGQGFPDYPSYVSMGDKVQEVLTNSDCLIHQYTRSPGNLNLVNAIGKYYSLAFNRIINPLNEILITVGGYGSLFNAFSGLLDKDDEVIIIEPFFDCYAPMSILQNAKCVYVPLKPKKRDRKTAEPMSSMDWSWDINELETAFNNKTKLIVINTPNNPLGKVYSKEELEIIAKLCIKHNTICISDEVYEHIVYDKKHISIATLPDMYERTLTIGSAGKAFSSTGVKIGWTVGPKELIKLCQIVHNNSIYCCPTFFQEVIAKCFEDEISKINTKECYFNSISEELRIKRDRLAKLLSDAGLTPVIPEGGYFMLADISNIANNFSSDEKEAKDSKFVKYLIKEKGLATIPSSVFFSSQNRYIGENFIRFCFIKNETTLENAANILKNFKMD